MSGRFLRSRKAAQAALEQEASLRGGGTYLPQGEALRVMSHLVAADASHALQDRSARDQHLQEALSPPKSSEVSQPQELLEGVQLRAARWALDDREPLVALKGLATLSQPRRVVDRPGAATLAVPRGEIRLEQLTFGYGGATDEPLIRDLDLHIRPGERVGLVGRSGAGKSTLTHLLLRFHDLQGGRILIDGQDIAAVTQDSLRAQIGMVTQDTSLLHRSVRDNILYGRPDAGDAEMIEAACRAEADGFIRQLSDPSGRSGYDAQVGERGVKLSGGQRQRIAIARVILKDAPILLLDEATSALDSEVEAAIQTSLDTLMQGKTVVAIAHRLSTIAAMDRLVVLDRGRIVEQGDHATLLAQGGLYARLWARQSGGFIGEDETGCIEQPDLSGNSASSSG